MADWQYFSGPSPALIEDDVVAVVGGEADALAAIDRVRGAGDPRSLAQLIDRVLDGGSVAAAPAFFLGVRSGAQWRCAVRGAMEVVIDEGQSVSGASAETWHELLVEAESSLALRVLLPAADPWQSVSADGPLRIGGLRREGEQAPDAAREVEEPVDLSRTLVEPEIEADDADSDEAGSPEAGSPELGSPAAGTPELGSPESGRAVPSTADQDGAPSAQEPRSRYDSLFGELTIAGGVAAAAVAEHAEDHEEHSASTDTAADFDHSGVAVSAIFCPHRHPNPPERAQCWRCSEGLDSKAIVRVPRPSLGRLVLDDGRVIEIDHTILVGRNPRAERTDAAHLPALVSVGTDAAGVSRTHARIFLDGWQVLVEDLGSTYGTSLVAADGTHRRLRPGQPELVLGDSVLDLGGGSRLRIIEVP